MKKSTEILESTLLKAKQLGATHADAVWFETVDVGLSCRNGKPEGIERSESSVMNLRVFIGDSQAIVSSTDSSEEALNRLAEGAIAMARATPPDALSGLAPTQLYPSEIPNLDLCEAEEPTTDWLFEQAKTAEAVALQTQGITNSEGADASYSKNTIALAVMQDGQVGFAEQYNTSHSSLSVSVLAGSGTEMQRDYDFTTARHRSDLLTPESLGKTAAEKALKRMHPRKINSAKWPVMYDPRVSRQLLSAFASCINGSSVVRGGTFLKDAMDSAIFSSAITIIDDPRIIRGMASRPFDGEAVATQKRNIVEAGVLKSWLLDMRSSKALGLATTGNASRGVGSPPSPSSTNFYMLAGSDSPKALMKQMKTGLYITETFGTGINHITGDYSQGASGFWVENGEITYPVAEITVAGHLRDMFANAIPADDLIFRYATNAPSLLIDGMMIAGS